MYIYAYDSPSEALGIFGRGPLIGMICWEVVRFRVVPAFESLCKKHPETSKHNMRSQVAFAKHGPLLFQPVVMFNISSTHD